MLLISELVVKLIDKAKLDSFVLLFLTCSLPRHPSSLCSIQQTTQNLTKSNCRALINEAEYVRERERARRILHEL